MPVTINVNGLSLVHKGSDGISSATVPDTCKTPTPGGPVPIPYPNVSRSASLVKGTRTVKADGGNMIAIEGSEFSESTGDEPGSQGGVKSGTTGKESTWLTFSFDVEFEGKGACRLTDKMLHNHGNAANLAGEIQETVPNFMGSVVAGMPPGNKKDPCEEILEKIKDALYRQKPRDAGKGLMQRWEETAKNLGPMKPDGTRGAPITPGSAAAEGHEKQYKGWQNKLNKDLKRWKDNDCWDKGLPEANKHVKRAYRYGENEPQLGPGKPLAPPLYSVEVAQKSSNLTPESIAKAMGVSVGTVVTVLVISRIVRCFPPLWPLQASPI